MSDGATLVSELNAIASNPSSVTPEHLDMIMGELGNGGAETVLGGLTAEGFGAIQNHPQLTAFITPQIPMLKSLYDSLSPYERQSMRQRIEWLLACVEG